MQSLQNTPMGFRLYATTTTKGKRLIVPIYNRLMPQSKLKLSEKSLCLSWIRNCGKLNKRNMAKNKFRRFGNKYWNEKRSQTNNVVGNHCKKHDKNFWKVISPCRSDTRYRNGNSIILNETDKIVNEPSQVAEIFNEFFTTVASDIGFDGEVISAGDAIHRHKDHPSVQKIQQELDKIDCDFEFSPVTVDLVMQSITNIDPKKATGYDNIPGKLIRMAYREVSVPICNLMNTCIAVKTFPTPFIFADVSPISKVMIIWTRITSALLVFFLYCQQGILNDQMLDHFREIFDVLLSAHRRHYSCQTILLKFVEDVKSALDGGNKMDTVFMDLSKAFDCLPHDLFIAKLHAYSFSMSAGELISNYLNNRQQCVKILKNRRT